MVWKGNLAIFKSTNISETKEATPTKIDIHACDINPYLHDFFEPIPINKIFWPPMNIMHTWLYIVHGPKGKFGCFEDKK